MVVVVDGNDGTPIIDFNNPIHRGPNQNLVGGIYLVCEIKSPRKPKRSQEGVLENDRLSGLVPLLSSYVQITPGNNCMLLGENRNDVIGHLKMPPLKRWDLVRTSWSDLSQIDASCKMHCGRNCP